MEDQIKDIAHQLKDQLWNEPKQAIPSFIHFTRTYALRRSLRQMALLHRFEFMHAQSEEEKSTAIVNMIDVIDEVLIGYQERSYQEEMQKMAAQELMTVEYFVNTLPPQEGVICEGKEIRKQFGRTGFSLKGIDVQLKLGEITGIVGENANGKTTLFRILVGELARDAGKLRYPGLGQQDWDKYDWYTLKQQIAYVPQDLPKWSGNLKDELHYEAATHGLKGFTNHDAVDYIVARLGLTAHLHKRWKELSGGYKLRFALAKALVWKPKFLVIDEPLANLDVKSQVVFLSDLKELAKSVRHPICVLISSQHIHELESIIDNMIFLRQGKVLYQGDTVNLKQMNEEHVFEFSCPISVTEVRTKLNGFHYFSLEDKGLGKMILRTSTEVDRKKVLQTFAEKDIDLTYFRDISQSVKTLFYEDQ